MKNFLIGWILYQFVILGVIFSTTAYNYANCVDYEGGIDGMNRFESLIYITLPLAVFVGNEEIGTNPYCE